MGFADIMALADMSVGTLAPSISAKLDFKFLYACSVGVSILVPEMPSGFCLPAGHNVNMPYQSTRAAANSLKGLVIELTHSAKSLSRTSFLAFSISASFSAFPCAAFAYSLNLAFTSSILDCNPLVNPIMSL